MFSEIFRFELRQHVRSPLFWVGGGLLFLIAFLAVSFDAVAADIGGAVGGVHRNAPYVIMRSLLQLSLLAVFVSTAFVAGAVVRDHEHGMQEIFFSSPLSKRDYILGRFGGAMLASVLLFAFVVLAFVLGGAAPWADAGRLGPFRAWPYLHSLLMIVLPNLLLFGAIGFAAATATRRMIWSFVAVIAVVVANLVSRNLLANDATQRIASLLDPFGWAPVASATRYWTTAERNQEVLAFVGPLLWNRLLWLSVGLGLLAVSYAYFSFTVKTPGRRRVAGPPRGLPVPATGRIVPIVTQPSFGPATHWRQLLHRTGFELAGAVKSAPFLAILALGIVNFTSNALALEQFLDGTRPVPVTRLMVEILTYFTLYVLILLTVYGAEILWRHRAAAMDELTDALPAPNWVLWGGSLGALVGISVLALLAAMAVGVGVQLANGYTILEPGLYLRGFFLVNAIPLVHFAVLVVLIQVVVNHRYGGYLGVLAVMFLFVFLTMLGLQHPLFALPGVELPGVVYSDMNGYGPHVARLVWFYLYATLEAVLLLVLAHLFWVRGKETGLRSRLAIARRRWTPRVRAVTAVTALALASVASWIYYNTNVINEYFSQARMERLQAGYEQDYGGYRTLPQPRITRVRAQVDIYPHRRALEIRGSYRLRNNSDEALITLHVTTVPLVTADIRVEIPGARLRHRDEELGYAIYELSHPLAPGGEMEMEFQVREQMRGFLASTPTIPYSGPLDTHIVENGSFIRSDFYFPHLGYEPEMELRDPQKRRKYGLGPRGTLPSAVEPDARRRAFRDADWIDFETVVSTSEDQTAIGPGDLVGEWREAGRRFFRYRVRHPYEPAWVFLSARWAVAREAWNGVEIAVYYHPAHAFNVRRMIDAAEVALDTYSESFGPYPERVLRIVEFPRYASFGESHSTQVLISESSGFLADVGRGRGTLHPVFSLIAHEVAHEWWGNSTLSALARGRMMGVESLAEYSRLIATRRRYGEEEVRRDLGEMLDLYLRLRGRARQPERPLVEAGDDQQYVLYPKGGMALYALADQFGEEAVNGALARFYADHAFSGPPFATSRDVLGYLTDVVPPDRRDLLEDWFETVTLYDLRAREATVTRNDDGKYVVRLTVEAHKLRADGDGEEHEIPIDASIDVGVFAKPTGEGPVGGRLLSLEKHRIRTHEAVFTVVVDEPPGAGGIDPFHKLIDSNPDDNRIGVAR